MSYYTLGAVRNDIEIQLNQGASIVIYKEADSLYPLGHAQLSAPIPTIQRYPIPWKSIDKYI